MHACAIHEHTGSEPQWFNARVRCDSRNRVTICAAICPAAQRKIEQRAAKDDFHRSAIGISRREKRQT